MSQGAPTPSAGRRRTVCAARFHASSSPGRPAHCDKHRAAGSVLSDMSRKLLTLIVLGSLIPVIETSAGPPLPQGYRSWECVPGVIRDDGSESFHIEVDTGGPVAKVEITSISNFLVPPGNLPIPFRDDGLAGDRIAGDSVYTAGPFTIQSGLQTSWRFWNSPDSPGGIDMVDVGRIEVKELDSSTWEFLLDPSIGILSSAIPSPDTISLPEGIVCTPSFVNLRSTDRHTQRWLRGCGGDPARLISRILRLLPDAAEFVALVSTDHVEHLSAGAPENFISGIHQTVRLDFSGMGRAPYDDSARFGSRDALLGVVALDTCKRGLYSANIVHELLHQWTPGPGAGLADSMSHYLPRSNIGSLLGGFQWVTGPDGVTRINCEEGRNGAHRASPFDLYMMGLTGPEAVPPIQIYSSEASLPLRLCDQPPDGDIQTWTLESIAQQVGPRVPSPDVLPRVFNILFVAESHGRSLSATELAFCDRLARHFAQPASLDDPPYVGFNWVPVQAFFGPNATWSSLVPLPKADSDGDGDVDAEDVDAFTSCLSGPEVPLSPGCEAWDFDRDGDVDQADFGTLQILLTGPAETDDGSTSK